MFINFTNHPSALWSEAQIRTAEQYGEILDIPFPSVPAEAGEREIERMAEKYAEQLTATKPNAVLCQGEMTLTYAVVKKLTERNITVLAACSERCIEEQKIGDSTKKTVVFNFIRFRKYEAE